VVGASPIAPELRNQLEQSGCRLADVTGPDWVASFGHALTSEVPKHLLLLNESQVEAAPLDDSSLAEQFAGPFEICRQWVAALEAADALTGATLVAVTRMGGDFGFQASGGNFAGGGLTGLLKGVRREYPALRVKVLDFDWAAEPATIARELSAEVGSPAQDLEVGFKAGTRYVVQAVPQVAPHDSRSELKRGGVWVVSGGGRGVTSVVARQLGRQFGLKLHLLGTAPLPAADGSWRGLDEDQLKQLKRDTALRARREGKSPADEWRRVEKAIEMDRNLNQFAADGVSATYHQCDIRDRDSLAAVLAAVRQADGPIDGILHGAGIEAACKFVRKKPESVAATIASKCDGAAHLISLTRQDPLQCFVGFGSTSGRFGGLGQADYSLASDLLAKMMGPLQAAHPHCAAVCFHWPAWGEVGMAVRPESKMALEHGGISFMPTREGVAHLVAELQSGTGEREILLLDKPEPLDTDGTMSRTSAPADPETFRAVESREAGPTGSAGASQPTPAPVADSTARSVVDCSRMPLIRAIRTGANAEEFLAEVPLEATTDPFLVHHQFRGGPFLPAVLSLEMFAEAAAAWKTPARVTGFRDIELKNGWTVDSARNHEALVRMTSEDGGVRCDLIGPFYNSQGELVEKDRVYVSGLVELGESAPQVDPIVPGKPVYDWFPFIYPEGMDIYHGSPFRTLQKIDFQHGGGRAIVAGRPRNELIGDRPGGGMLVSAAALDGCMVACGAFGYAMLERSIALPLGMEHYQQVRLPKDGEQCTARFFLRDATRENSLYDIMLLGEEGDVIFDAKGYRTANVRENA
jgi:NAD(P)-dependent dehydrogenase (short-subunit alcohol dehydrogenase family)